MKNKPIDLNNILYEQLERLNDEELTLEDIEKEISRSDAMTKVAEKIIKNRELELKIIKHSDEYGYDRKTRVDVLVIEGKKV